MTRLLIQVVPALPPATNGVGDYALAVARVMRREFGLDTLFLVGNEAWQGPEEVAGFGVRKVTSRSAHDLEAALDAARTAGRASSVLLQLSCYGYSRRGCPFWLLQGLKRWRAKQTDARLVTMFHELYASGPPWKSAFWISPAQKIVVAGIARRSDIAVTTAQRYREILERFDPSKRERVEALAIPSTVGEPSSELLDLNSRSRDMVVFGQAGLRTQTYKTQILALRQACQRLGVAEIHDVGPASGGIPDRVGDFQVRMHGRIAFSDLHTLFSNSMAGFLTYPCAYIAKSSVFASYCAHRLVPVVASASDHSRSEADGIECGIHYLSADSKQGYEHLSPNTQSIADAAWKWYQGHSVRSHARTFAGALRNGRWTAGDERSDSEKK